MLLPSIRLIPFSVHYHRTGGRYRVCWLEGETELVSGCMRPSGDIGYVDGSGQLYCVGRTDRQIKRAGHRVNLDSIQQVGSLW